MSRRALWFLLPGLVWLSLFLLLPLLYGVYISFTEYELLSPAPTSLSFANYNALFSDLLDNDQFSLTLRFAVISSIISVALGTFASRIFMFDLPVIRMLRPLFTTPLAIAPAVAGLLGRIFFNPIFGGVLINLSNPSSAQFGILLVDTWLWVPLICVIILTMRRDRALYPFSFGGLILSLFFLRLLEGLRLFDLPLVMTQGGPAAMTSTLAFAAYTEGFRNFNIAAGAAISTFLLFIELALVAVFLVLMRRIRMWDR